MARALVCGASTFLGAHLLARLAVDGHEVIGVDRLPADRATRLRGLDGVPYHCVDCSRPLPDALVQERYDFIYQVARPAAASELAHDPLGGRYVGLAATLQLAGLASETSSVFVLISACGLLPPQPPTPDALFGGSPETLRYAEKVALAHQTYGNANVRLAQVWGTYGPGMPTAGVPLAMLLDQTANGTELTATSKSPLDLCFVSDIVSGIIQLALSEESEPVAFGTDQLQTLEALADALDETQGSRAARGSIVTGPGDRVPDLTRARTLLGWRPATPLDVGLRRTLLWIADQTEPPVSFASVASELAASGSPAPPVRESAKPNTTRSKLAQAARSSGRRRVRTEEA